MQLKSPVKQLPTTTSPSIPYTLDIWWSRLDPQWNTGKIAEIMISCCCIDRFFLSQSNFLLWILSLNLAMQTSDIHLQLFTDRHLLARMAIQWSKFVICQLSSNFCCLIQLHENQHNLPHGSLILTIVSLLHITNFTEYTVIKYFCNLTININICKNS